MSAMFAVLDKLLSFTLVLRQACKRFISCVQMSPLTFLFIFMLVLLLVACALVFNILLARLLTVPGAVVLNLGMFWLVLRLVVRILVFPGSVVLWKRNTEASYRVEMSKQFMVHLEQLLFYLQVATGKVQHSGVVVSLEGAHMGWLVIEGLSRNFRLQQRDKVRFTEEQARVRLLVQGVEAWLVEAKVYDKRGRPDVQIPLVDWLQRTSQSVAPVPMSLAVASSTLVGDAQAEAPGTIERIEQLLAVLDELQKQQDSCCATVRRFLTVPTVGSLHQLRAELQARYTGHHYWVRGPGGRKIDAMFIPCRETEATSNGLPEDGEALSGSAKEDVPLKELVGGESAKDALGSIVVWCNPNAAYYETMAYESHWLDFYRSQGCSVFFFNYSGFGRSEGAPSPSNMAADGDAVIDFLRRRGFKDIGVHGRSIGGIAACSLAKNNPDVVKLLVADRTFSTLARAARFTFGNWAVHGLAVSATWADNSQNYLQARCRKIMICDPKDATIPDLASLRTEVALQAVASADPSERLDLEADQVKRFVESWCFLETLISICDRDEPSDGYQGKRPARQPVIGKPMPNEGDAGADAIEDTQRLVANRATSGVSSKRSPLTAQWLEEHIEVAQAVMSTHINGVRLAMDLVGSQLNASGMTLDDTLGGRSLDEAGFALKCFLSNLQVWGSLGSLREPILPGVDRDLELLLAMGPEPRESRELASRLSRVHAQTTPERLAAYHRGLSRKLVAHIRREFRQCLSWLSRSMEVPTRDDAAIGPDLFATVLGHLRQVEGLLTTIYRFFKCLDLAGRAPQGGGEVSDDSEDPRALEAMPQGQVRRQDGRDRDASPGAPVQPAIDRAVTGYMMCIDCGHNGVLNDAEAQNLVLHLKSAKFGRWSDEEAGGGSGSGRSGVTVGRRQDTRDLTFFAG